MKAVFLDRDGTLIVDFIDPRTNRLVRQFVGGKREDTLRVAFGAAWIVDELHGQIWRVELSRLTAGGGKAEPDEHRGRPSVTARSHPAVGIGYRSMLDEWTRANLDRFDVLEVTVDNLMVRGETSRAALLDLVGRIPLTAH